MPSEGFGVPVLHRGEEPDLAVAQGRDPGAVGGPHHVRRVGDDLAVVLGGGPQPRAVRREQGVLARSTAGPVCARRCVRPGRATAPRPSDGPRPTRASWQDQCGSLRAGPRPGSQASARADPWAVPEQGPAPRDANDGSWIGACPRPCRPAPRHRRGRWRGRPTRPSRSPPCFDPPDRNIAARPVSNPLAGQRAGLPHLRAQQFNLHAELADPPQGGGQLGPFEPPRVSESVFCSKPGRRFQGRSSVRGMRPPLPAAADARWRRVAARCCTS